MAEEDWNNNSSRVCQQAAQVQQHTLDALQRIHMITAESENVGMTTLEELHLQRAKLEDILAAGDNLHEHLETTERLQNTFGLWNFEVFSNLRAAKREAKQEIKSQKAKEDIKTERTLRLSKIASVAPDPALLKSSNGSICSSTSSSSRSTISTTAAVMSKSSVSTSAAVVVPHSKAKNTSYYHSLYKPKKSKRPSEMFNENNKRKGLLYGMDTTGHENEQELLALAETDEVIDKELDVVAASLEGLLNMTRTMNAELKSQDVAMEEVEKCLDKAEYKTRTANERTRRFLTGKPRAEMDKTKILGLGI